MGRIPKIIHYCWFGGNPLSEETKRYIDTWKAACPDWELMRWDESSFDVTSCDYAREAYEAKKWAFLTDYVRLWALEQYGGVYMDTDVELLGSLEEFLDGPAFCGFETEKRLSTALIGTEKGGAWVKALLDDYSNRHFLLPDGSLDMTTNVTAISGRTERDFGVRMDGSLQRTEHLAVYPVDWFSPMTFETGKLARTENTRAIHHFVASWHDERWLRERDTRYACIRLFGETLGEKIANAINFARRRDGSFRQGVLYYLSLPLGKAFRLLPLNDAVVFETEGDFCDNGRALYEYMLSRGMNRRHTLVWLVKEPERFRDRQGENVHFVTRDSLEGKYYISRARHFFFTHPWWLKNWRKGQIVVSLWHGMLPLKAGDGKDLHEAFDFFLVASPAGVDLYEKFLGLQPRQALLLGLPRLDLLTRKTDLAPLLGGRARGKDYEKLILSMPTFRQAKGWTDGSFENAFSVNPVRTVEQLQQLNDYLRQKGFLLVAKIHHLQKLDFLERVDLSNILYLTDEDLDRCDRQLNELVGQADCLLTDYSSIYFDFLQLDRPIGFFIEDMAEYTRGFVGEDPVEWMPGEKIGSLDELYAFLEDVAAGRDEYGPERKTVLDRANSFQDDDNCRRIVEHFGL